MTDDKNKTTPQQTETEKAPVTPQEDYENNWVHDMKQELEDYIEEQGIYIRQ